MVSCFRRHKLIAVRQRVLTAIVGFGCRDALAFETALRGLRARCSSREAIERPDKQKNCYQADRHVNTASHSIPAYQTCGRPIGPPPAHVESTVLTALLLALTRPLHSAHYVLSWELSNTMETGFCLAALHAAFRFGQPEIWNSDQGSQFTSADFLAPLKKRGILISMDGRGRALDNVFIERLWRSLKYELIYPGDFASGLELFPALENYFHFYNHQRPHQALDYQTPADLFPHKPKRKRSFS